jgi:glycosyltransferase involved in cell wall biosynthesis
MTPKPEIIYYLGVGSSICSLLPRLFGIKTVVNVDGLDWKRGKWGKGASWFLHLSEKLAIYFSNLAMTDSDYIQKYYQRVYKSRLPVIPYGYNSTKVEEKKLVKYGVVKDQYLIWTGRLVPDNHLDELLKAYRMNKIKMPLLILGDSPHEDKYKQKLHDLAAGLPVKFLGFVGREEYGALVAYSRAYIETKRSGGTHPSLVESMGHGCLILANNHRSHQEVLGDTAIYYTKGEVGDLAQKIKQISKADFNQDKKKLAKLTQERAKKMYSWERIVDSYVELFGELTS